MQNTKWTGLALRLAALAVSVLGLTGCFGSGDDAKPADTAAQVVYVGAVEGTDALIAIAPQGNLVVAYVCAEKSWATHTGWFYTELENDAEHTGKVRTSTSGSNHTLEATTITDSQAVGTVRFADGSTRAFTAARADPRTTAGLYRSHASEGQAGLIVTNDGRAAGAVQFPSGGGPSQQISVTQPLNPSSPTSTSTTSTTASPTTPGTGTGADGIGVFIPELGPRTLLPVIPAQTAVSRKGPTLYILVHGMNHPLGNDPKHVDTPVQSRGEWHLDFIQGLLGGGDPGGGTHVPMFDFAGKAVNQTSFMDPAMLPVFNSFADDGDIVALDTVASHFVTTDSQIGDVRKEGLATGGTPPQFSAFVTYRDAAGGLVESGKRIANQTYVALRWYELHFRVTPKVVYVAQSFGGVTARFVLSNPTQAQLDAPGNPLMNPDKIQLAAEDGKRMNYVRDRIMYIVTLGTPHEGSFMADLFVPLQQSLQALEASLENGVANLQTGLRPLGLMLGQMGALAAAVPLPQQTAAQTLANVRAGLIETRRQLNGRALRDLTHAFWERVNNGPLHPGQARRSGLSPIVGARGQLVPIYAAGARTPGGRAFTSPELSAFARFQAENKKEQEWMTSTMVTDLLIHAARANQGGFGKSTEGVYAGFSAQLDRRERIVDGSAFARTTAADIASSVSPWFAEEFGAGVEGITKFVMGNARLVALPVYLDRKGGFNLGGSVSLPVPSFQCTSDTGQVFRIKLEFGELLTLMRRASGSLRVAANGLVTMNLVGVFGALAASAGEAISIGNWFIREYVGLNVPTGRCHLGIDLGSPLAALLSAVNILNWSVANGTDTFPAPRWAFNSQLASDGEIDDDGVVGFASAMGFSLGTQTPLFFDHTRADAAGGTRGSWYRMFDSPVERECHGMQHQWSVGQWTFRNFAGAGPVPGAGALSVFP